MNDRHQLIAYLATLTALVIVFCVPFIAAGAGVSVTEAFGVGVVTGGLIGLLRTPTASKPVASTDSGDVNVTGDVK